MKECPVLLGTPTIYCVMPVIKESEINQLAIPWVTSRLSCMFHSVTAAVATPLIDVANKTLSPTELNEIVRTSSKVQVPLFGHKIIHGKTGLILQGYKMNVMSHDLEKRSPQLPLGIEVLYSYATLTTGSDRIAVSLWNSTEDWVLIDKGVPIVRMEAANLVPPVTADFITSKPQTQKLTEEERQKALMEKLDLSGLPLVDRQSYHQRQKLPHGVLRLIFPGEEQNWSDQDGKTHHHAQRSWHHPFQGTVSSNTTSTGGGGERTFEVDARGRSYSAQ